MTTNGARNRRIKVGLFALGAIALVGLVLIVFGGMRFWRDKATYRVVVADSVWGLERGAAVLHNGIRVGTVERMETARDDLDKVVVSIEIDAATPVRTDTEAVLRYVGITGLKIVDLRGGSLAAPVLPRGGTIPLGETMLDEGARHALEVMRQSDELVRRAVTVLERTEEVMTNLAEVTDSETLTAIDAVLANARETSANLARTSETLDAIVGENRAALRASLASIEAASRGVVQVVGSVDAIVADIAGVVSTNETQLQSAVNDIRQATRSFRDLARDLKARPSRLLFSKAAKDRKLP
jgi:phospholipid/cholesterol/gamma-HCH transport system substrate-binding protein